jgi:hypothetical protein
MATPSGITMSVSAMAPQLFTTEFYFWVDFSVVPFLLYNKPSALTSLLSCFDCLPVTF